MAVTTNSYGPFNRSSGTIAEVLQELASNHILAERVIYYSDDGTDAKAVWYGQKVS